jgi:hypothetical protein
MHRGGTLWFAIAGLFAVARWLLDFVDIQYYDPESLLDYSGVFLQTAAGVTTGVALLILWRDPPVRRGAFLIGLAGVAATAQGLGNLVEDGLGWEWGVWGFFVGGVGLLVTLALAGILALTVRHRVRWSGVFLILGATGGMLGLGLLIMGLTWIALSYWIHPHKSSRQAVVR